MKSISRLILTVACSAGILSSTFAADVKKNKPSKSDVEDILEAIGEGHFPEKMKLAGLGSVETESTYYHVFYGTLKNGSYHLIFFDNTPAYLGYYLISYKPIGHGKGVVELYLTSDSITTIPIGDEGPKDKISIEGATGQFKFVRAPVEEEPEEETVAAKDNTPSKPNKKPEYRSWNITKGGKVRNVTSAIFVELKDKKVTIKDGKSGQVATFPISTLSAEDKAYLKDLLQ